MLKFSHDKLSFKTLKVPFFAGDIKIENVNPIEKDTTNSQQNYNTWLKGQSKIFQIDVLGKTKADLFREGGLSVDKFVNNTGQTLTLDQLRSKYPTAWANANN